MKKLLFSSILFFIVSLGKGQITNTAEDSVKNLICHKWGVRAVIFGGQEITNGNEPVTYEFFKDYTLKRKNKKSESGAWAFDPVKQLITIKIKDIALYVIKLVEGDLVITVGSGPEEANSLGIATALKIIK